MHFAADEGPWSETFCLYRLLNYVQLTLSQPCLSLMLSAVLYYLWIIDHWTQYLLDSATYHASRYEYSCNTEVANYRENFLCYLL